MKIADVIKKGAKAGEEMEQGPIEAEKLRKQREELKHELDEDTEEEQYDYREDSVDNKKEVESETWVEEPPEGSPREYKSETPKEERRNATPEAFDRPTLYKLTFVLEDGSKVCPIFECPKDMIGQVLEAIDIAIEQGKVITIEEYKIPGSRVMYVDLKGRD